MCTLLCSTHVPKSIITNASLRIWACEYVHVISHDIANMANLVCWRKECALYSMVGPRLAYSGLQPTSKAAYNQAGCHAGSGVWVMHCLVMCWNGVLGACMLPQSKVYCRPAGHCCLAVLSIHLNVNVNALGPGILDRGFVSCSCSALTCPTTRRPMSTSGQQGRRTAL